MRSVVLSYGTGVESTAIILRWLEDPASRDFPLEDLVVQTAHTGNDWAENARLVEQHLLPRLRAHGVRYVQVARAGLYEGAGVVVLDDSRAPTRCFSEGAFRLSDELTAAGTVPQFAHGRRRCSVKYKGFPMDVWLDREFGPRRVGSCAPEPLAPGTIIHARQESAVRALAAGEHVGARPFRHVLGFNAEELFRVERDRSYSTGARQSEYPLLAWGWARADCERYLLEVLGVRWPKSCCEFCPFSAGRKADIPMTVARMVAEPAAAARALALERRALALNPRMPLYAEGSLEQVLVEHGAAHLASAARRAEDARPWAVYRVQRYYPRRGTGWRSVRTLWTGPPDEGRSQLARLAGRTPALEAGCWRVYEHRRGLGFPAVESMLVLGPAGAQDKEKKGFAARWAEAAASASYQTTLAL